MGNQTMPVTRLALIRSLSALALGGLLAVLSVGTVAGMHALHALQDECTRLGGTPQSDGTTCIVADLRTDGSGLRVPATMTLAVGGTLLNDPIIIGPGPGVLHIDLVTVDGELVISGTAENYGPVQINGRLVVSGSWTDGSEMRYVCDEIRDICGYSWVEGYITNAGAVENRGSLYAPAGATNHGQWLNDGVLAVGGTLENSGGMINAGTFSTPGTLRNRGALTNTGTMTLTGWTLNRGTLRSTGLLANRGALYNWGRLEGRILNHGVIYSMGVLSATIEGEGSVYEQPEALYLPEIRK